MKVLNGALVPARTSHCESAQITKGFEPWSVNVKLKTGHSCSLFLTLLNTELVEHLMETINQSTKLSLPCILASDYGQLFLENFGKSSVILRNFERIRFIFGRLRVI